MQWAHCRAIIMALPSWICEKICFLYARFGTGRNGGRSGLRRPFALNRHDRNVPLSVVGFPECQGQAPAWKAKVGRKRIVAGCQMHYSGDRQGNNMARTVDLKRPRGRPPTLKSGANAPGSIQALDRALNLLEHIAAEDGLLLTDVAARAGVAPSTAHRILTTLEAHDYVVHDEEHGFWLIGVKAFDVGSSFLRNRKLAEMGRAIMRDLMETCGESVHLSIEDNGAIVFVSQIESHHAIRAFHRPGSRGAIHASGAGKALLATLGDDAVRKVLHKTGLQRFTDKTLDSPEKLFAELEVIRARGWAVDNEERTTGMRCVAATIFDEYGEAIAGLSISGPTVRLTDERLGELGPMVKRTAEEITRSIGGHPPTRDL